MNRLAVRIALAAGIVIVLVGGAVLTIVTGAITGQTERRFVSRVMRAQTQVEFQLRADAELRAVGAAVLSGLPNLAPAIERRDIRTAAAVVGPFMATTVQRVDRTNGARLYDANGMLLTRFDGTGPPAVEPLAAAANVAARGVPASMFRHDEVFGLSVSGMAPVFSAPERVVGVIEVVTQLDDDYVRSQAQLLDASVAIIGGAAIVAASSDTARVEPDALTDDKRAALAERPGYVPGRGSRLLASTVALRGPDNERLGDVIVGIEESEVLALVTSLRAAAAQTAMAGVAAAVFLTSFFAWLAVRPIGQLAFAARRIQENDLESSVPQSGPHEVRELAGAMEDMRRALQQSREALLLANRDLALRVAESSAGLSEVTGDLQAIQRIVAHLAGESSGGLPAVVEELAGLQWVQGAVIALATAEGRLSVAASASLAPGAATRVIELLEQGRPDYALPAEVSIPDTARDADAARLRAWRIGGLAAQPMFTPEGIAGVVCITSDGPLAVTPQRRELLRSVAHEIAATLERSELADEVEENRHLAEAVLREMSDGVIVVDQQQICRICNPAAARLLSRTRSEILGRPAQEWLPLPPSAIAMLRDRTTEGASTSATPLLATAGNRRLAISGGPLHDPDPDRTGMILLIRDLSAEAEADRVKRDFVSMVGHELRTPLTMIRATVDLLREQDAGKLNVTQERIVEVLNQNADRLLALITDLLDMSALDSGRMPINPTSIDIGQVAHAALEAARPAAEARGHTLRIDAPRGTTVWADAARVHQVLGNLLSNAIKYTPEGGDIDVRVEDGGPFVTVSVTDNGIGISPAEQEGLFEKFYRASGGRRTTGGTGLGLAIARSIVELHGGTIRCESDGHHGTTFAFTLPHRPL